MNAKMMQKGQTCIWFGTRTNATFQTRATKYTPPAHTHTHTWTQNGRSVYKRNWFSLCRDVNMQKLRYVTILVYIKINIYVYIYIYIHIEKLYYICFMRVNLYANMSIYIYIYICTCLPGHEKQFLFTSLSKVWKFHFPDNMQNWQCLSCFPHTSAQSAL